MFFVNSFCHSFLAIIRNLKEARISENLCGNVFKNGKNYLKDYRKNTVYVNIFYRYFQHFVYIINILN